MENENNVSKFKKKNTMKLINKTFGINGETFVPEAELTLRISLETIQDQTALLGYDSMYTKLGKELIDLLNDKDHMADLILNHFGDIE